MELPDPHLSFAFEARVNVAPAVRIGSGGPGEVLYFVAITGGTVAGPRLSGEVVPGGGDWFTDRDGVAELDARYLLRVDDGTVIDIENRGFWRADAQTTVRLDAGEHVDEREYYYRTSARFHTDAPGFAWLTQSVVVGLARQEGPVICLRFFTVD
ncbi:MAG: DUF3237 family protein [Actinobacteria bacterium]|uniref:Unannotated protein n=1 Tax=freshwater metagenome TaxID=449393 RepID=A0A6J7PXP7_9ZZZZ|nr:DUF3237 family protein [Actinomycetota bacterium]